MSTTHKKRHFSDINDISKEPGTKKRKTVEVLYEETAILEFINLSNDILGDDIVYFIQKDYNIESKFFDPKFLELSRDNAIKLVKQSPIDIDGYSFKCQLYDGKLPRRRKHTSYHNHHSKTNAYHKNHHNHHDHNHNNNHNNNNNNNNNKKYNLYTKYKKFNKYNEPPEGICGYTVWIGNITKKASKPYLISILEKFGEILNVYVLSQNSNHFNCAFVDFISPFDILAIGKAVFYRKLKIYDVPISIVLREKTIDKLFYNGYKKQLNQMINYGMLNIKHKEYYHKLCDKYNKSKQRHRSSSRHSHSHSHTPNRSQRHSHSHSHSHTPNRSHSHTSKRPISVSPYSTESNTSTTHSHTSSPPPDPTHIKPPIPIIINTDTDTHTHTLTDSVINTNTNTDTDTNIVTNTNTVPITINTVPITPIIIKIKKDEEFEDGEIKEEPEPGTYDENEHHKRIKRQRERKRNIYNSHGHIHGKKVQKIKNNNNKQVGMAMGNKCQTAVPISVPVTMPIPVPVPVPVTVTIKPENNNVIMEYNIDMNDILKDMREKFPDLQVMKQVHNIGSFQDYGAVINGFTDAVNINNIQALDMKQQVEIYKHKRENVECDLRVLGNCELIFDHIKQLTQYNQDICNKMDICDADIADINGRYKMYNENLLKNKLKLENMKQEFILCQHNNENMLQKYDELRDEWVVREGEIKHENMRLLNEFSLITEQVRNQTDEFEAVDVEQKAKNARHSLLYHKIESKKKEINGKEREYNKLYRDMENEYNDVKMRYENEQMQHKNTQKVLADTVSKVKESIKSINKRAQDKDLIIQRLQNRLKMYKNNVESSNGNSNNSNNVS